MFKRSRAAVAGMLLIPFVGAVVIAACGGSGPGIYEATQGVVIQNVTVVNTRDGSVVANQSVVVDGGKITKIALSGTVRPSGTAQVVDASGKFVIPGFMDMHSHALFRVDANPSYFPLMIANGVTSWRDMAIPPGTAGTQASWIARGRQLQSDTAASRVDAPELLLIPSLLFQGVTSAASASDGVDQQKALGADFIKVISANRAAMLSFLSESKKQGIDLAGHMTPAVSALESSQLGWKSIEHLGGSMGLLMDCSDASESLRTAVLNTAGISASAYPLDAASIQQVLSTYDIAKCQALAAEFVKNGTWVSPTVHRMRGIYSSDDPALVNDPDLAYVDKARVAAWTLSTQKFAAQSAADKAAQRQLYTLHQRITKLFKQSGVKMVLGTDAGLVSTWVIPGFGIHDEFHELTASGLSPLEILQMTTLNAAEFMHRETTMGTIDEGKLADLLLLDGNPIQDVTNLDKISGVFLRGKYFAKSALDKLKSDTAALYASQSISSLPVIAPAEDAD